MCIVSNWVNEPQYLMAVTKYDDLPNSLIPNPYQKVPGPLTSAFVDDNSVLFDLCNRNQ